MMLRCLAGLAILLATSVASAAPTTLTFAGRLTTSSGPVTGQVTVQFRLFAEGTDGTAVWGPESHTVTADNGLVYANLGTLSTLDQSVFNGQVMYLEIQVGSEVLSPRLAINSVPYALQSETANLLGGTIGAADVVTDVVAGTNITATKTGNDVAIGLVTIGCSSGEVYKWNGSSFACEADNDTKYTGGTGIAVSGTTVSLSTTGCVAGEVWKYNGATFSCEPDLDTNTTYTGTTGIVVSGTTISLSTTGCDAGEALKYTGSTFACQPDTNTTYAAGNGITIDSSNHAISVNTGVIQSRVTGTCAGGAAVAKINSDGTVVCVSPDGGVSYKVLGSLNHSSANVSNAWTQIDIGTQTFEKTRAGTAIELRLQTPIYSGTFASASGVYFELRVDDTSATFHSNQAIRTTSVIEEVLLDAIFPNLTAGTHTVTLWARTNAGTTSNVQVDPGGWGGAILVKED